MANEFNYDIGGIGPNSNSTQGYFQYLVADEVLVDNEIYANKITVDNNLLVKGRVKATNVELVQFQSDNFDDSTEIPYDPPKILSQLFDKVDDHEIRITALESGNFTGNVDLSGIESRLDALESIDYSPPDLSSLTDGLAALQTRTGTLESLIGLLTNNNPTDTAIENRIAELEKKIEALVSVYQSVKAIHNMPLNI